MESFDLVAKLLQYKTKKNLKKKTENFFDKTIIELYTFFLVPVRKKGILRYLFPSFAKTSSQISANSSLSQDCCTSKATNNEFYIGMVNSNNIFFVSFDFHFIARIYFFVFLKK